MPSLEMDEDVSRDGNCILLVIFAVMAGDFNMQQSVWIFAEDHGEICVTASDRIETFEIAAFRQPRNEFGSIDRIDWCGNAGFDRYFKDRRAIADITAARILLPVWG